MNIRTVRQGPNRGQRTELRSWKVISEVSCAQVFTVENQATGFSDPIMEKLDVTGLENPNTEATRSDRTKFIY